MPRLGLGIGLGGSSGGAWRPALLTGFNSMVFPALSRLQGRLWQDSGKTTAATADGHPVFIPTCPYSGLDFTVAANANRPTLRNSGAFWWLEYDNVDDQLTRALSLSQPFTLFAAGQVPTAGASFTLFDGGAGNQAYGAKSTAAQTTVFDIYNGTGFASSNQVNTANTVRMIACFNGGSSRLFLNGTKTSGSTSATALTGITIGCRSGTPTLASQRIYAAGLAGNITDAEAGLLDTWLAAQAP